MNSDNKGRIMQNSIFKAVIIGAIFYIALILVEGALHPSVLLPGVIGAVVLALLATVFGLKNEHAVHKGEVIVLWTMVLLFVAYGLFQFIVGGVFV